VEKCNRYKKGGKAIYRAELLNESDYTIVNNYQLEYRGIANYYQMAYNMHVLGQLKWVMEQSLTMTLASKHHLSVPRVYDQFKAELEVDGTTRKGLRVIVPREGKKPLVAVWGGISLKWDIKVTLEDQPPPIRNWAGRSELEKRLLAQVCEQCGATKRTDRIEVHHIRALKDLNQYTGREKPAWVKNMAARRRKTLVLCRTCHEDVHAGRPMRRQTIKLMNVTSVKTE
jgi:hypothetical protein